MIALALLGCTGVADVAGESTPGDSHDTDSGTPADSGETGDSGDTGDTADPCDADADGFVASTCGGDDCHDGDESIHPGATELCDPVDHDCDGEALAPGVCGAAQDGNALMSVVVAMCPEGDTSWCTSWGRLTPDVTGDGAAEVLVACKGGCEGWVAGYGLLDVTTLDRRQPDRGRWFQLWYDYYGDAYAGSVPFRGGDIDGDGINDVAFASSMWVFPVPGPFSADPVPQAYHEPGSDYANSGWPEVGFGLSGVTATGDMDGDGDAEIAWGVSGTGSDTESQTGAGIYIVGMGGRAPLGETWPKIQVLGLEMADGIGSGRLASPGDLDGDGLEDLLLCNGPTVIPAADLASADGARLEDVMTETWWDEGDNHVRYLEVAPTRPGDIDGDGLDDWLLAAGESTRYGDPVGELFFVAGGQRPPGDYHPDDANGSYVIPEAELLSLARAADLDGDGAREIVFQGHDLMWIVRGRTGFPGFAEDPSQRLHVANSSTWNPNDRAWDVIDGGSDVSGDGLEDVLFSRGDAEPLGDVGLLLGWEIPWDDPAYW